MPKLCTYTNGIMPKKGHKNTAPILSFKFVVIYIIAYSKNLSTLPDLEN